MEIIGHLICFYLTILLGVESVCIAATTAVGEPFALSRGHFIVPALEMALAFALVRAHIANLTTFNFEKKNPTLINYQNLKI
jgi:hypothetical protein